ncbi:hypothetical protein GCM10010399_61450 [Dactylosporangium fulvum]|uniref:Ricin-type beta-trefoil lectin domain protein n=1 Tax=Dactylosporangium fulvum TaxID=53359 RepID=A0ABY5W1I2_9ACTN|nr:ricin-type beta-trefoil lectin domain protein [Dactylosporangium fulvum]UWP83319.1 ricin-type beta-trefoil lectin domain protein [Dactylosporangium fulvum]
MTVAGDGNDAGNPDKREPSARRVRHRVPPAASGPVNMPALPEPFSPAKPTFPAVPHQRRRNGPTAIATATVPAMEEDAAVPADPEGDPDPATVGTPAGQARASAAVNLDMEPTVGEFDAAPTQGLEFIVSLPGAPAVEEEPADPPTPPAPSDSDAAASSDASSSAEPATSAEDAPTEEPAAPAVGAAPVPAITVAPDDSPTVADYVPPAFAIVTDEPHDEDGPDYHGNRRKLAAWRRYPVGAVAVAVVILLITGAVVAQLVRGDSPETPSGDRMPQKVPSVNGLPGVPVTESPSPSTSAASSHSASPSASRSRTTASQTATASASHPASPSPARTTTAPPPAQLSSGRVVGVASNKCMEYRASDRNRVVLDTCDRRSNQRWTIQGDGTVRADGSCLDVMNAGTGNGTPVQLYSCNGTPAQKWTVRGDGTWQNPSSGRCLDAVNGGTGAGTPLVIWDCSNAANQRWTVQTF